MDLIEAILTKRSIRNYIKKTIDDNLIDTILKEVVSAP
jgi:hypothetical protein